MTRRVLAPIGYQLSNLSKLPPDVQEENFLRIYQAVHRYTMTTPERLYSLMKATEYVAKRGITGDLVECGVWQGGSAMAMALASMIYEQGHRRLFLYDTFEGMSLPTARDRRIEDGFSALEQWSTVQGDEALFCAADMESVRRHLAETGYPSSKLVFVKGRVEETIPATAPDEIALLRLDTDWYESTYHELEHLYPRLTVGGVIIVDDYGYWRGSRDAVDQYFREHGVELLLHRVDASRIAIKA